MDSLVAIRTEAYLVVWIFEESFLAGEFLGDEMVIVCLVRFSFAESAFHITDTQSRTMSCGLWVHCADRYTMSV